MENYEKKYEKLVDAVKVLRDNNPSDEGIQNWVNDNVPELKESDDERIRKWLIDTIKSVPNDSIEWEKINKSDVVAWLEKQDSYYTFEIKKGHWYKCVCDYMLNGSDLMFKNDRLYYCRNDWRLGGEIDERNVKDIGVNGYKSFFRPATNQEIKDWLEKQCEQKPADMIESIAHNYITPNQKFFQWIYDRLIYVHNENPNVNYMLSLKERIENMQKPVDVVEPKFKVGDKIKTTNEESLIITKIDEKGYWSEDLFICDFDEECIWDLVEQKAVDMVEPKTAWSDEDEYLLNETIQHLEILIRIEKNGVDCDSQYYQRDIDWLKSIKERITSM